MKDLKDKIDYIVGCNHEITDDSHGELCAEICDFINKYADHLEQKLSKCNDHDIKMVKEVQLRDKRIKVLEQRIKEQDKLLRKLRKIYLYDINFVSKDDDGIKTPLMEVMSTWDEVNKILNQ